MSQASRNEAEIELAAGESAAVSVDRHPVLRIDPAMRLEILSPRWRRVRAKDHTVAMHGLVLGGHFWVLEEQTLSLRSLLFGPRTLSVSAYQRPYGTVLVRVRLYTRGEVRAKVEPAQPHPASQPA